jgi:hypothetical protein
MAADILAQMGKGEYWLYTEKYMNIVNVSGLHTFTDTILSSIQLLVH